MWLTDLATGPIGGALVAATALLVQKRFENDRAREERRHADARADLERKDAAETEQRDYQRNRQAAWREERKIAHTHALSALNAVNDDITHIRWQKTLRQMEREGGVEGEDVQTLSELLSKGPGRALPGTIGRCADSDSGGVIAISDAGSDGPSNSTCAVSG